MKENQIANLEIQKEQMLGTGVQTHKLSKGERKKLKQEKKTKALKYQLLAKRKK